MQALGLHGFHARPGKFLENKNGLGERGHTISSGRSFAYYPHRHVLQFKTPHGGVGRVPRIFNLLQHALGLNLRDQAPLHKPERC